MAKKENSVETPINCLRNEKVTVRLIKKQRGSVSDPRSPLAFGMAETAQYVVTVPRLRSGILKNVLTDAEMECIEGILKVAPGTLSVYKQENNYWCTSTPDCINKVILTKQDTVLDLSNVYDFIRYKILLANNDIICPSLQELEDRPKNTYRYVLINEAQEAKSVGSKANLKYECFMAYGKWKDNADVLRCIIELMDNKKMAPDTKIEHLQSMVTRYIDEDTKRFKDVITDELLEYKALIKKGVEKGLIANRNNFFYMREDNMPICEEYEEPRLSTAAKYLANPANQDLRDSLIAKLK